MMMRTLEECQVGAAVAIFCMNCIPNNLPYHYHHHRQVEE